jgi:trk system potassium uptake protein TrkH
LSITGVLLAIGTVMVFTLEHSNPATMDGLSLGGKVVASVFQAATPRTAGFYTVPVTDMKTATKFLFMLLMFIGGSPGSTAGGIKTTTAGVLVLTVYSVIKGREDTEVFGRRISNVIIYRSLSIAFIALFLIILTTIVLSITEGFPFFELLFEAVSAFSTTGITLGITRWLTPAGKIMIMLTMFAGRVGPLTVAFALAQRQDKGRERIRYPEGKILVG